MTGASSSRAFCRYGRTSLHDETLEGCRNIVCKLRRALRAERRRGVAGHWTYDLARHVELLRVYRLELASSELRDIKRR